jgi:hypothetical protein
VIVGESRCRQRRFIHRIAGLETSWIDNCFAQMTVSVRAAAGCLFFLCLSLAQIVSGQVVTTSPDASSSVFSQGQPVSPEYRRLQYHLTLDIRGAYSDNIELTEHNQISDYYVRFDPGLSLGYGDLEPGGANFLHLDYNPDFVFFLDHSEFNAYQHAVTLGAQSILSRLTLALNGNVEFLKGFDFSRSLSSTGGFVNSVNLDVRGRPETIEATAQATAAYDLGGKTSLGAGVQTSATNYTDFNSTQSLAASLFINYAYSPKLTFGIGGIGGRQFVDQPNADETFEQANFRMNYSLTGKLTAGGSVGVEFRQYDSGQSGYVSPIFDLGINYTPFDGTALSISGSRRIAPSGSQVGQDFSSTQFTVSGMQRFFERCFLRLTGGYENDTYVAAAPGVSSPREDNYFFIEPEIDVRITRFWYAGGFYQHRQDNSSASNLSFNENQVGFRLSFAF